MEKSISNPAKPKPEFSPRRVNDFLAAPRGFREAEPLFDEFWREGELAILFGPASSGKSVLAVQLCDAIARGGGLPGFRHPRGRRRVLYVDLTHTDEQFRQRCSRGTRRHTFPRNLFRDRSPANVDLCDWLDKQVSENGFHVVVIDDLSAFRRTGDGTRETLPLMRRLKELRERLGISILVVSDSAPAKRNTAISEAALGRSRFLCSAADTVFAIDRDTESGDFYLTQTRSRNSATFWTADNAPIAELRRTEHGLLAFEFDERFSETIDEKKKGLICRIKQLADEGKRFREIASELGLSKSWTYTLSKRWTPAMAETSPPPDVRNAPPVEVLSEPPASAGGQFAEPPPDAATNPPPPSLEPTGHDPESKPEDQRSKLEDQRPKIKDLAPRLIRDLEPDLDPNGREIWVQARHEYDNRPKVWYMPRNNRGEYSRCVHAGFTIYQCNVGSSGLVPHDLPVNLNDQSYRPKLEEWQSRTAISQGISTG